VTRRLSRQFSTIRAVWMIALYRRTPKEFYYY